MLRELLRRHLQVGQKDNDEDEEEPSPTDLEGARAIRAAKDADDSRRNAKVEDPKEEDKKSEAVDKVVYEGLDRRLADTEDPETKKRILERMRAMRR